MGESTNSLKKPAPTDICIGLRLVASYSCHENNGFAGTERVGGGALWTAITSHTCPENGESFWGVDGSLWTIKASAKQTSGRFSLIEEFGQLQEGTPLHVHPEDDESFYILEGELTFYLGDEQPIRASAGSFVHIPGGVVHAFRVESETARYLIITTAQHESFYRAISKPAQSRSLPPQDPLDMEKVEAACREYGVEILGPPPGAPA
jgi:quercetin dioxygenase-like cupin family protein